MEHIVQFGISIDDAAIYKTVKERAADDIINRVYQNVMEKLFQKRTPWANATSSDPLTNYAKDILEGFLEQNRDLIVSEAGKYLAERLSRTKAAKEILKNAADGN